MDPSFFGRLLEILTLIQLQAELKSLNWTATIRNQFYFKNSFSLKEA